VAAPIYGEMSSPGLASLLSMASMMGVCRLISSSISPPRFFNTLSPLEISSSPASCRCFDASNSSWNQDLADAVEGDIY
jgi:hypothetical protein